MENSFEVLGWFNNIKNKNLFTFMKFDVVDFYPSISNKLLIISIQFARKYIDLSNDQIEIILHRRYTVWREKLDILSSRR